MTPIAILTALLTYGPGILPLIAQIHDWIKDGKKEVTPEDIALLISYGKKTSDDYLAEAGVPTNTIPGTGSPLPPPNSTT